MECNMIKDYMSDYIDNQLSNDEKIQFEKHINECEDCKYELQLLKNVVTELNGIEEQLPEDFHSDLMLKLKDIEKESNNEKQKSTKKYKMPYKWISTIAAACLVLSVIGYNIIDRVNNYSDDGIQMNESTAKEEHKVRDNINLSISSAPEDKKMKNGVIETEEVKDEMFLDESRTDISKESTKNIEFQFSEELNSMKSDEQYSFIQNKEKEEIIIIIEEIINQLTESTDDEQLPEIYIRSIAGIDNEQFIYLKNMYPELKLHYIEGDLTKIISNQKAKQIIIEKLDKIDNNNINILGKNNFMNSDIHVDFNVNVKKDNDNWIITN